MYTIYWGTNGQGVYVDTAAQALVVVDHHRRIHGLEGYGVTNCDGAPLTLPDIEQLAVEERLAADRQHI
jgi:hypothetical protein